MRKKVSITLFILYSVAQTCVRDLCLGDALVYFPALASSRTCLMCADTISAFIPPMHRL